MGKDWPVGVVTLTIWAYWATVILLVIYKRMRFGQRAGVIPKQRWEKRLWLGIVPVFLAWNTFPALSLLFDHGPFSQAAWASSSPEIYSLRCGAAVTSVVCYLATLSCWLLMGRNWSMAIVPGQKTELVTGGLFGLVRHPIYSLSILLMILTAITVATAPMAGVALLHIALMTFKAKKEEQYLTECHGSSYGVYCQRVGRFFPRLRSLVKG